MLIKPALTGSIDAIERSSFTEIDLDSTYPHLDQVGQFVLVPLNRIRIGEIQYNIFIRKFSFTILHIQVLFNQLAKETVLRREIRQLPQTSMEAFIFQIIQHQLRIGEAISGKLVIALPVGFKPAGIKVNHIGGDLMLTQVFCYVVSVFLGEISDAAHPGSERPQRRHSRLTHNLRIFIQNIFRFSEENEKVHCLIPHEQLIDIDIGRTKVAGHRGGGMHEHSIAAVTHKEGDRFILLVGFRSLGVGYKQVYSLSHFIQRAERLTATENLFVRSQREYRINAPAIIRPTFDKIERDNLSLSRVVIMQCTGLRHDLAIRITQNDTPGVLFDGYTTVGICICHGIPRFCSLPGAVFARFFGKHQGCFILRFHRCR